MSRLIKDYVEVDEQGSLDGLIERLTAIRASLPTGGEAEVRMRGDDIFGRRLRIGFLRPMTSEEAACEGRYGSCPVELRIVA